jgi:hypothetical protein
MNCNAHAYEIANPHRSCMGDVGDVGDVTNV